MSVSGDTVLIGASGNDDNGSRSGSTYVFVRNNEMWTEQAKLVASDSVSDGFFGSSVSVGGDTALILEMVTMAMIRLVCIFTI